MNNNFFTFKEILLEKNTSNKFVSLNGNSLIYVRKGDCLINFNKSPYTVYCHDYFLLAPSEIITIENIHSNECLVYILTFSSETIDDLNSFSDISITSCFKVDTINNCRHLACESENAFRVRTLLLTIKMEVKEDKYACDIYLRNALSMLIVILNRLILENIPKETKKCKKGLRLDDIFNYVNAHLTEEISLDKLSEDLFFSKYHILHEFKKKTGISLYKYIIKRKLEYSKTLIEHGMPISDVCHGSGFGDYSNFLRAFKKEFGFTPKQYYNEVTAKNCKDIINV